jgi:HAMP domain-containing protein
VRAGLSTRIFAGFLVLLLVFAGASLLSVRRLHAIREDLVLIHRGYLAMGRTATQVRTLQEAKDAYVSRALATQAPDVRRQLVGYAKELYAKAVRDRLDELEALTEQLAAGNLHDDEDARFLAGVADQVKQARDLNDAYDDATARLLDAAPDAADVPRLLDEQHERGDAFGRQLRALSLAFDGKVADAVLRAERDERDAAYAVVVLSIIAGATGAIILFMMIRALKPLRDLVDVANAIGKGYIYVRVNCDGL